MDILRFLAQWLRPAARARSATAGRFRPAFDALEERYAPATFTVLNTSDAGAGSLRQAILNANSSVGVDTINFSIAGAGVRTINLASALPVLTGPVHIDATTQPGFAGNPLIELDGSATTSSHGLIVSASGCSIRGLIINDFDAAGIFMQASNNIVQDCWIGLDASGNNAAPNGLGLIIVNGVGNIIGGTGGTGNVLSGNLQHGLVIQGAGSSGNLVQGNFMGTNAAGTAAVGNVADGVALFAGATNNTIGGTVAGTSNLISGNGRSGVDIHHGHGSGSGTTGNRVEGNRIGLSVNGAALGNNIGVFLFSGATANVIGGFSAEARNIISGNTTGMVITGAGTIGNVAIGNFFSTDTNGNASAGLVSTNDLIIQGGATGNAIGSTGAGRNLFGSAAQANILIHGAGTRDNRVQGNLIGVSLDGASALGSAQYGVWLSGGTSANLVGGVSAGAGNVIGARTSAGVRIDGAGTNLNLLHGNRIGTNAAGSAAIANNAGVVIDAGAFGNSVGDITAGSGNLISGNSRVGVEITGDTSGNLVRGNLIGTNASGTGALGNLDGLSLTGGAVTNLVGGATPQAANVISGNTRVGVRFSGAAALLLPTRLNNVQGNRIGVAADGVSPLGNGSHGVIMFNGGANNFVGGAAPGAGNVIAFNGGDGVLIGADPGVAEFNSGAGTSHVVWGNSIHSNAGQGIDLGANNGVTANDANDADSGTNNFQNFPVITGATTLAAGTLLSGTLNSTANRAFRIEFFSSPSADASGNGEGRVFLGAINTTSTTNNYAFALTVPTISPTEFITATATDLTTLDTSEFSPAFDVP